MKTFRKIRKKNRKNFRKISDRPGGRYLFRNPISMRGFWVSLTECLLAAGLEMKATGSNTI